MAKDKEDRIIAKQRLLVCSHCQKPSRTPCIITTDLLPVRLTCPHCVHQSVLDHIPDLPKVEPPQQDAWWIVEASETWTTGEDGEEEEPDSPPVNKLATFMGRSSEITATLMQGLEQIYILQQDILAFEKAFFEHFTESARLADFFRDNWNPHYLRDFVENPFTVIKIRCQDKLASHYARLILSPHFIKPNVGISLPSKGGLRLELVNQYSLVSKPIISQAFREYLSLPAALDLQLAGKKIYGSSLEHCWKDIPHTIEDGGHSPENPSIIMHPMDSLPSRIWLAQHGTAGWSARGISDRYLRVEEVEPLAKHDMWANQDAWEILCNTSRLGIFWFDIMRSRGFAVKAMNCIKGNKLIVLSRLQDRDAWEALGASSSRLGDRCAFHCPSASNDPSGHGQIGIDRLADVRMIVVDHLYAVNLSFLRLLFDYDGILLVLCDDPFLDFSCENLRASLLYGLVCQAVFDEEDKYIQPDVTDLTKAIHWEHPLLDALANIRREQDHPEE